MPAAMSIQMPRTSGRHGGLLLELLHELNEAGSPDSGIISCPDVKSKPMRIDTMDNILILGV
jgi:hypothetical protein